ncbi:MAG: hypothetical protein J3R72DRAFT_461022 [Linnemannia gamsii]|nr:MAG: hypothetical protein J3R72DRAFT_461022 [Linnemannia gamsii]
MISTKAILSVILSASLAFTLVIQPTTAAPSTLSPTKLAKFCKDGDGNDLEGPYPADKCNNFVICGSGSATLMMCPPTTYFNEITSQCDNPDCDD